jgi:hypothetical protein
MCRLIASSAVALCATQVFADLSAEDVWADWKAYSETFGYTIAGIETRAGDTLTITGVTVESETGDALGVGRALIDRIVLTEQGDGSIIIDFPAIIPLELTAVDDTLGAMSISMDYRQSGSNFVASGTSDAIDYTLSIDSISVETTGIEVDGEVQPEDMANLSFELSSLQGSSQTVLSELREYTQSLSAESVSYTAVTSDPASGDTSTVSGQFQDVSYDGTATAPMGDVDSENMDAMLAAGFAVDGVFEYAANAMTIDLGSAAGDLGASVITGNSSVGVLMGKNGLTYDVAQKDVQVQASSSQFPLPLDFNIANSTFNITVPVRQSDAAEDFAFGFALDGFTMSDVLWGLFDPTGQLPRDPATIAVDLAGKARVLMDLLDPTAMAQMNPQAAPAELESLDIKSIKIAGAGAELTGDGAFTFDNAENAMPKPTGAVDLTLKGANGLIDKLIATGMLPQEQAVGVRMMMGLLAVPGSTPDTLNSKIEINSEGHVLANGQRIQ